MVLSGTRRHTIKYSSCGTPLTWQILRQLPKTVRSVGTVYGAHRPSLQSQPYPKGEWKRGRLAEKLGFIVVVSFHIQQVGLSAQRPEYSRGSDDDLWCPPSSTKQPSGGLMVLDTLLFRCCYSCLLPSSDSRSFYIITEPEYIPELPPTQ